MIMRRRFSRSNGKTVIQDGIGQLHTLLFEWAKDTCRMASIVKVFKNKRHTLVHVGWRFQQYANLPSIVICVFWEHKGQHSCDMTDKQHRMMFWEHFDSSH